VQEDPNDILLKTLIAEPNLNTARVEAELPKSKKFRILRFDPSCAFEKKDMLEPILA
jgi:hypothetical protein